MSIEAMKQWLEALDNLARYADTCELLLKETHPGKAHSLRERVTNSIDAITSLRQAIAEAEKQEPVAWLKVNEDSWTISLDAEPDHIPLYTTPQPKQEPVAWLGFNDRGECREVFTNDMRKMMPNYSIEGMTPVYTTPQQRKPLTDIEICNMVARISDVRNPYLQFARAIEAAHGIKE